MEKTKINQVLEYSSPILIISYFFIHNILLVVTGIIISLYLININAIYRLTRFINTNLFIKKNISKESTKNDTTIKPDKTKTIQEATKLTLVEAIEEFGIIPSKDNNDNENGRKVA